ncbi:alpha/beta hydrolase [Litorimonas sp. RW-G-Af-16]
MPKDWQWHRFSAVDGTNLRWGETGNRGASKATIIIVPGYTATLDMYGEHVDLLAERGYHVMGLDLRGQGGSDRHFPKHPEKMWVEDFAIYSDDLAAFIKTHTRPERVVMPMAMSFGGHVAARMAVDHPNVVDGYFLVAPAIEPLAGESAFEDAGQQLNTAQKLGQGAKYLPGNGDWMPATPDDLLISGIEYCSSNPKRLPLRDVIFTRMPDRRVGGVTVQWGAEFFQSAVLMKQDGYFDDVTAPVTMIAAERDDFVSNAAIDRACEDLADCKLVRYPGTGHCLPQETDDVVFAMFDEIDVLYQRIIVARN